MKKIFLAFVIIFAISFSLLSINSCTTSTTTATVVHDTVFAHFWDPEQSGVTATLISVSFPTLQIGTAVGAGGAIVHTIDGGNTWSLQSSGTYQDLYGISFSDVNTAIAVGSIGVVLKTTDGGANWMPLDVNIDVQFRNVQMVNSQIGFVIGTRYFDVDNTQGFVYKTINGGLTWTQLNITTPTGLYGLSFSDQLNGWVSGLHGQIFHTSDGGATWTLQSSGLPSNQQIAKIAFADATHGIAVGLNTIAGDPTPPSTGFILTTSDAGATWTKTVTTPVTGLWMPDVNHATVVGYNGTVMETADGGQSWTTKKVGSLRLLNVFMNDANNGAMVGENGKVYILGSH